MTNRADLARVWDAHNPQTETASACPLTGCEPDDGCVDCAYFLLVETRTKAGIVDAPSCSLYDHPYEALDALRGMLADAEDELEIARKANRGQMRRLEDLDKLIIGLRGVHDSGRKTLKVRAIARALGMQL